MADTIECGHCNKAFNTKMRHCPFCGYKKTNQDLQHVPFCPRCQCELTTYEYRDTELDICPECSGLWLDDDEFTRLTSERDVYADPSISYEYVRKPFPQEKGYLPCVRCGSLMPRKNFGKISGVLIDVCRHHGVWLDAGELEQIRCFIANGGLEKSQDKEIVQNRTEIESLANRVSDVEFMQKVLHRWDFKRWLFKGF